MREISIEQFINLEKVVPIDVRSPEEFREFHIPGAINIPLFSNEERAEIGTTYKQIGAEDAKWRAMEIVSPKIPSILGEIKAIHEGNNHPVIYCWRGGMRSKSVATFLSFAGLSVPRLIGGYRAYRQYILEKIPQMIPSQAYTIHGMTGVGKTELLHKLQEKGFPIIDLEGLADHRGSIFGTYGLDTGHNQKTFDALLYQALSKIKGTRFFVVEAESKRIGKVVQPDELFERKLQGININIHASLTSRIDRIYREYVKPYYHEEWFQAKVIERLAYIKKRIKEPSIIEKLDMAIVSEDYKLFIKTLLEDYYDPRYSYKQLEYVNPFINVNGENIDDAVGEITNFITEKQVIK